MITRRALVAASALLLLHVGACSKDTPTVDHAPDSHETTTARLNTSTTGVEGAQAYVDSGDYVTGVHVGFIKSIDINAHKIDVDIAQFLTGDAAVQAYKADVGEQLETDYYVRNQNKRLRTFDLSKAAVLRVINLGGFDPSGGASPDKGHKVSAGTFAGYFDDPTSNDQAATTLFWIRLKGGVATRVEEQYVP